MKRVNRFRLVVLSAAFISSICQGATYYISNSGNDSSQGTSSSQPWSSLNKVNNTNLAPGDSVLFKRGDKWEGSITVKVSGTEGNPIVFGAYGTGEKPIIYGSTKVNGWTKHSGNIYKASLDASVNQLFVDGVRLKIARHPNSGYAITNSVQNSTTLSSDILDSSVNYQGALWIGRTEAYSFETKTVTSSNSKTLTLSSSPYYDLGVKEGFILLGKLDLLDSPGEWYYDSSRNTVYVWTPAGDSPSNHEVRCSIYTNGFSFENKKHITIKDLAILHMSGNGIYGFASSHLKIENNDIYFPDGSGIKIAKKISKNNTFRNNIIKGANHNGLQFFGHNNTVSDNHILDTAILDNLGTSSIGGRIEGRAIDYRGSNNTLRYNRIIRAGGIGIGFYEGENSLIEYNFVKDVTLNRDDLGGIYTWNEDVNVPGPSGSIIRNNIVVNSLGFKQGYKYNRAYGFGIYMDGQTHNVILEGNTVVNSSEAGIFLHKNKNTTVRKNTVFNARQLLFMAGDYAPNIIEENIFYAGEYAPGRNVSQMMLRELKTSEDHIYKDNVYVNHYSSDRVFNNPDGTFSFSEWESREVQESGSTFYGSPMASGNTEQIFYNDQKDDKVINLNGQVYEDVHGNTVSGSLILKPFTSKILIGSNFQNITENDPGISTPDINQPPVLNTIGNRIVAANTELRFSATATDSTPDTHSLTFSLDPGAPIGATITSNGQFSWTPTAGQAPGTYDLGIRVTDNGNPPLDDHETISITVSGEAISANLSPIMNPIGDYIVQSGNELRFIATATGPNSAQVGVGQEIVRINSGGGAVDPNYQADEFYSGGNSARLAATITSDGTVPEAVFQSERHSSAFEYTVSNLDPESRFIVDLHFAEFYFTSAGKRIFDVTINGTQVINDYDIFARAGGKDIGVTESFSAQSDQLGNLTIAFTSEVDHAKLSGMSISPVADDNLTFTLDPGAPSGASITADGSFSWTPTAEQAPGIYNLTVRVTDNSNPSLEDLQTITIAVENTSGSISTNSVLTGPVDETFNVNEIGTTGVVSNASYDSSNDTFRLTASGGAVWGTKDDFQYVYREVTGDVEATVKVSSLAAEDPFGKAGIMLRDSSQEDSKHAFLTISAGKGVALERRHTVGGGTTRSGKGNVGSPVWLRLIKEGTYISAYYSEDGDNWSFLAEDIIDFSDAAFIGLAAAASTEGDIVTAEFGDLEIVELQTQSATETFISADIGKVGVNGDAAYDPQTDSFIIEAAGGDIGHTQDAFHYVFREVAGDFETITKIDSLTAEQDWAKAGLMARDGIRPNAPYFAIFTARNIGVVHQNRSTLGGNSNWSMIEGINTPIWVKLSRTGNLFQCHYSSNGASWELVDQSTLEVSEILLIGMAVTSHEENALAYAEFSNLTVVD